MNAEVGGGMALELGKQRVQDMVEDFGGRVTSAISGKTNLLVVGKQPGFTAVTNARSAGYIRLITLQDLADSLRRGKVEVGRTAAESCAQVIIEEFSDGYHGNSKALTASRQELEFAKYGNARHLTKGGGARPPQTGLALNSPRPSPSAANRSTPTANASIKAIGGSTPAKKPAVPPGWKLLVNPLKPNEYRFKAPDGKVYESLPQPLPPGWKKVTSASRPGVVAFRSPSGKIYQCTLQEAIAKHAQTINKTTNASPATTTSPDSSLKRKDMAYAKTFLCVDYADRELVKRLGARFDGVAKKWYVNSGIDLGPFSRWLPQVVQAPTKRPKVG